MADLAVGGDQADDAGLGRRLGVGWRRAALQGEFESFEEGLPGRVHAGRVAPPALVGCLDRPLIPAGRDGGVHHATRPGCGHSHLIVARGGVGASSSGARSHGTYRTHRTYKAYETHHSTSRAALVTII